MGKPGDSELQRSAPAAIPDGEPGDDMPEQRQEIGNDGGTSNSQNPTHTYTEAGTYTVMLTARSQAGRAQDEDELHPSHPAADRWLQSGADL
jgi:hypothetical protein